MDSKPLSRDKRLALGYGSAWHLLRSLGWQRGHFTARIAREVGASSVTWLDSPAATGDRAYLNGTPIRDDEWKRIAFVDDPEVRRAYADFWPSRGEQQNWDVVGRAIIGEKPEWLLVEAKAHPAEIRADGTTAREVGGRPMIRAAFKETLAALGHDADASTSLAERWLTGYYQHANRLATLHFFNRQGVAARLIFLYFYGDQHPEGTSRPTKPADWTPVLNKIHDDLGLKGTALLEQRVHNVFMPVDPAADLPE